MPSPDREGRWLIGRADGAHRAGRHPFRRFGLLPAGGVARGRGALANDPAVFQGSWPSPSR